MHLVQEGLCHTRECARAHLPAVHLRLVKHWYNCNRTSFLRNNLILLGLFTLLLGFSFPESICTWNDSHPASCVLVVERFSKSNQAPRSFHLETHGHVACVEKGFHQQRATPLRRLPLYELQIADTLDDRGRRLNRLVVTAAVIATVHENDEQPKQSFTSCFGLNLLNRSSLQTSAEVKSCKASTSM